MGQHLIDMRILGEVVACPSCFTPLPPGAWSDGMGVPFKRCSARGCQKRIHITASSCLFDCRVNLVLQACIVYALCLPVSVDKVKKLLQG
eukprot:3172983-Amphidinium_carterae.1